MDPEERLERAAAILAEHEVPESLTYLVNNPWLSEIPGLSAEYASDEDVAKRKDQDLLRMTHNGRVFEIAVSGVVPFLEEQKYNYSELTLDVDGKIVLKAGVSIQYRNGVEYRDVKCGWQQIQSFQAGDWMDALARVYDACRLSRARHKAMEEQERLAKRAANIELGEYE